MRDFLMRVASFDPLYFSTSNSLASRYAALCGLVQVLLTVCAFCSYAYVGYLLTNNEVEAAIVGAIFSFFLFIFYRLSLLTSNRYDYCTDTIKKVNVIATFIKLTFMSLNILFFIYAFEMLLCKDALDDMLQQSQAPDGIISRIKILIGKMPGANLMTFVLYIIFMGPIIGRYLFARLSHAYDFTKTKHEEKMIQSAYDSFLHNYTNLIRFHSQGKAADIIYQRMKNPPFDTTLQKQSVATVAEEELYAYLDQKL
jgi:hypothetical protein